MTSVAGLVVRGIERRAEQERVESVGRHPAGSGRLASRR
jgi:hypothetical protein